MKITNFGNRSLMVVERGVNKPTLGLEFFFHLPLVEVIQFEAKNLGNLCLLFHSCN